MQLWPLTRGDVRPLLSLLLLGAAVGLGELFLRPDLFFHKGFLLGDASVNLYVADRLLEGDRLYQDVFYHYGPLPIYLHAAVSCLFANTMFTYAGQLLALRVR